MEPCKVIVLLSTYNGEQYLQEQLESIYNQTYPNIEILIRDDGSKDNTKTLLKDAEKQNRIKVITGENLGFVNSFFELLKQAPIADYYAYADQDDIWEKDKIQRAVTKLEQVKNNKEIPLMYYANYQFYDEEMKRDWKSPKRNVVSFENSLVECSNLGMTTVINHKAKEVLLNYLPQKHCKGHDWWTYMVCAGFGKVIFDDYIVAKHRVHEKNASLCGETWIQKHKRRITTLFGDNHFKILKRQINEFIKICYQDLPKEKKKVLELFNIQRFCYYNQIKKVFYPYRWMSIKKEEILLRIAFFLGIV